MSSVKIKAKLVNTTDPQFLPSRKYPDDAGADLRARIDSPIRLYVQDVVKVPTGVAVEIPNGCAGFIQPRSGASLKGKVAITGTIDPNYRGELCITAYNPKDTGYVMIDPGERLAQLIVVPVFVAEFEVVDELSQTDRGENGFGSTGRV